MRSFPNVLVWGCERARLWALPGTFGANVLDGKVCCESSLSDLPRVEGPHPGSNTVLETRGRAEGMIFKC